MMFYKITCLVAGVFHLVLTLFVVSRDLRSNINRVYALWGFALVLWNLSAFFKLLVDPADTETSLVLIRLIHLSLVFLPVSIFHLCVQIADSRQKRVLPLLYLLHIGLGMTVLFGELYIVGIKNVPPFGQYAIPGPAAYVYLGIYAIIAYVTIRMLYRRQKSLTGLHRTRLRSLLLGYGLLVVFGTHDILHLVLHNHGYTYYPGTDIQIYPLANLAAIFYGIIVAYGVLQHQLLDIHVALGKIAAQMVRVLFLFLTGLILLLIGSIFDHEERNLYPYVAALAAMFLTSVIAAFFFPRFFGKGEELLERRLLGDRFEYQDQVRGLVQKIRDLHEPTLLLAELQNLLIRTLGLRSYQIILLDEQTRSFSLFDSYPMQSGARLAKLSLESPIFRFFKQTNVSYLPCKKAYTLPGETELEILARADLQPYDPEFCFPLVSGEEVFGLLLLGSKESDEPFTPTDINLIGELVLNLRLVLDQIRLKNQIHLAQEQEMLGRMSRGLAHDLNNLLTPIQTCLQLIQSGITDKETMDEILPMAVRNIETIRSYVNEALFFSRNHSLSLKQVDLNQTLKVSAGLLAAEVNRKKIVISIDGSKCAEAAIDEVLIQRLICNLLSNAIDATPPGNPIRLAVTPLPRTERNRDWYRIQIQDSGEGITPENLKRVFMPYFSTKNTGDKRRGFGLGLAIARKIVHLHGGNLMISSERGKGTTVQVDLPSRPPAAPTKASEALAVEFAT